MARQANSKYTFKKAVTKLKLAATNQGKLARLELLATEYQRVVQIYCDLLVIDGQSATEKQIYANQKTKLVKFTYQPDHYAALPKIETKLSVRWQRVGWRQACGVVQGWFANHRQTPPVLKNLSIQASSHVVKLQKAKDGKFDYWLHVATLEKRQPILLPVKLYKKAAETILKYPCLFNGVKLEKSEETWFLTLVVGQENKKSDVIKEVVGVDLGLKAMVVSSQGDQFGKISAALREKVEKAKNKRVRQQKLNACLTKKGLPTVSLKNGKAERFVRNEVGRALNQFMATISSETAVALERLNVKTMNLKSKEMNRWLRAGQFGFLLDRLKFKLDEAGVRYRSVQSAYSSQTCSECGFVAEVNRRNQADFCCRYCGFKTNADFNAARNIAKRFGDDEFNQCPFPEVKPLLELRFQQRFPVTRSVTARLASKKAVGQNLIYDYS